MLRRRPTADGRVWREGGPERSNKASVTFRHRVGKSNFAFAVVSGILLESRHGVAAKRLSRERPMPNPAQQDSFWKDIHLLIVDDEQDMREIFAAWFRNLGCR